MSPVYAMNSIIQKPEVLSDDYVPEQVLYRMNPLKVMTGHFLVPIPHGESSNQ